jgi:branched-chain amino acid transport system permease protein
MGSFLWMLGQSLLNGLTMGGVYALVSVGLTVIFGVMKVENFAQGEYLVIGMYITLLLYRMTGLNPYFLIVPVAVLCFIFGNISFRVVIKRIIGREGTVFIIVTMGLSFIFISLLQLIFTANFWASPTAARERSVRIGLFSIGLQRVIACIAMLVFVSIVGLFLKKTDIGRAMRATSENTDVAKMLGINTDRIYIFSFSLGTMMAGLTGLLLSPIYYIYPTVGAPFKTIAMVVIVMGSLGNIFGAVVSGFIAGIIEAILAGFISNDLAPAGAYMMLILILILKPAGLFGRGVRVA